MSKTSETVIVTGAAGFIGSYVAHALLGRGKTVLGLDNVNDCYDVRLKHARLDRLRAVAGFRFEKVDLADKKATFAAFELAPKATHVVHLAAQAGHRHAAADAYSYVSANVTAYVNVLEAARRLAQLEHVVYASSSSVYGEGDDDNDKGNGPAAESARADRPTSLYAATKRADELMAHAYWHQYGMPLTGVRLFTVYGPWGRPDMAFYRFAEAITAGRPVTLYDDGETRRAFTYIDDAVAGLLACLDRPPAHGKPPLLLNVGNHQSEPVSELLAQLEKALGRRAVVEKKPRPKADVRHTHAHLAAVQAHVGFRAETPLSVGVPRFVEWFNEAKGFGFNITK